MEIFEFSNKSFKNDRQMVLDVLYLVYQIEIIPKGSKNMSIEMRIAEIEKDLKDLVLCVGCDCVFCPCNYYDKMIAELSQLYVDKFWAKFSLENGNCYVTGLEV